MPMRQITRILLVTAALFGCSNCASGPQAQDPFDVALGMAAAAMMAEQAPSDATMRAFTEAIKPPTVIQQTVVQQPVQPQQGGGQ
jgi:hypothetical protein